MLNKSRYLAHTDSTTMLLCPKAYAELKPDHSVFLDAVLHHEDVRADQDAAAEALEDDLVRLREVKCLQTLALTL